MRRTLQGIVNLGCVAGMLVWAASPAAGDDLKRRGMIGIQVAPVSEEAAKDAGFDEPKGILVPGVFPGMPAVDAGIQEGDIIYQVEGKDTADLTAFMLAMRGYYAGDEVTFSIARKAEKLERTVKLAERPKETSTEYDIIYDSTTASGHRIRTIVTKPKGEGKSPAVVLLPGFGGDSLEFAQPTPHPFKVLIDGLTNNGYVTIRAHLVGAGDSEGPNARDINLQTEVACHRAAIEAVKKYDFVDGDNVFVFAHSAGSLIAPLVAEGENVRGIAVFAATARPLIESMADGARRRAELQGMSEDEARTSAQQMQTFMQQCYVEKQSPADVLAKYPELQELTSQFLQENTYVMGRHYKYFQELAARDAGADWKRVGAPVLAVWGESDYVANKADSEFLVAQVNAGAPGKAEFVAMEGIDHNFDRMADAEESFLAGFAGDFNTDLLDVVKKWMEAQTKK